MLERWGARYALVRLISDVVLTGLALFLASHTSRWLYSQTALGLQETTVFEAPTHIYMLVAFIWGAAFLLLSIYSPRTQRAVDEAQTVFVAVTIATLVLASALFFLTPQISRLQVLIFYALDLLLLIGSRGVLRVGLRLAGQPRYTQRKVLLVGTSDEAIETVQMVQSYRWAGLQAVGFLDNKVPPGETIQGLPVVGTVEEIDSWVECLGVDEVIVALPLDDYGQFFRLIGGLPAMRSRVRLVPDHFKTALFRSRVEDFAGVPMITVKQPVLDPFERQIKRAFDLALSAIFLALVSPLLLAIAAAIRIDSPGPILFKQRRVGENGELFGMYKFRSMVKDAERLQATVIQVRKDGKVVHKREDDPRVTRVGKLIRRMSLDELPQLFNVLKGEMSLVGPRPELPWLVEQYEPWQWQRFSVPQGITGWWQVNGRSDKPMHLHTEEDLFYIQNYSFLLDIQILWRTVGAVLKGGGAY